MIRRNKFLHEKEYVSYFSRLIEIERQEEMKFHEEEIVKLSAKQREKLGRCITGLKFYKKEINSLGKYLIYLKRNKEIKDTEIKEGDVVLISSEDESPIEHGIQGNVDFIGKNIVVLLFDKLPSKIILNKHKKYRLDLYINEVTYRRIKEAFSNVRAKKSLFPLEILFGQKQISLKEKQNKKVEFYNENLNETQKEAVIKALSSEVLYLIHGPPGTGKTTTLVEIAMQLVKEGNKILVTADSNTAVDNFIEKFSIYADQFGIEYVRIGSISRINKNIIEKTLDYKVSKILNDEETMKLYQEIEKREREIARCVKPTMSNRRGLSFDDILKLSIIGKSLRGLPLKRIKSMAKYIKLKREIELLKSKINKKRDKIINEIINSSQVVFTTNSTAGSEILRNVDFDVVMIDESTQATEPSSLVPLIKGKNLILAGDHKQLPPTILSEKAKREGLEKSLFERLISLYPHLSIMLKVQYRMNEKIMNFSNEMFYSNNLIAHESIRDHVIEEYNGFVSSIPITFVNVNAHETKKCNSTSFLNYKEAELVKRIVEDLLKRYREEDIGIISPYKDQVETIKKILRKYNNLEVKTIDGFQGREKEIIILSLVRGNIKKNIGFLSDYRRLNVAITRARKKMIVIGNEKTLSKDKIYKGLIEYIKREGEYLSI